MQTARACGMRQHTQRSAIAAQTSKQCASLHSLASPLSRHSSSRRGLTPCHAKQQQRDSSSSQTTEQLRSSKAPPNSLGRGKQSGFQQEQSQDEQVCVALWCVTPHEAGCAQHLTAAVGGCMHAVCCSCNRRATAGVHWAGSLACACRSCTLHNI